MTNEERQALIEQYKAGYDEVARSLEGFDEESLSAHLIPGKWSAREVVQHLADSEIVYGYRIRMILASDTPNIEGYDQDAWAQRLRYSETSLPDALAQIRVLRGRSLHLLRGLRPEEWDRAGMHSERGRESIRHITKLLAAHDLVHLRQIERIKSVIGAA